MLWAGQGLCLLQPSCQSPSPLARPGEDVTPHNAAATTHSPAGG